MSGTTKIEWSEKVWNPVTGCDRVSPGCDHCYALGMAKRLKAMGRPEYQTDGDPRTSGPGFGVTCHEDRLTVPLHWRKPQKIFVNSMSDLFHEDVPDEFIARVFAAMAATPRHTYQCLTKRHGRMRSLLSSDRFQDQVQLAAHRDKWGWPPRVEAPSIRDMWPLRNVWLGVTVESQQWADIRVPALLATPAAVRWVSAEPLLGPLDLTRLPFPRWSMDQKRCEGMVIDALGGRYGVPGQWQAPASSLLSWVVVGGESGPKARPMHPKWARGLRDQCVAAGVPYHFKQWGEWAPAPWKLSREPGETDDQYKARSDADGATHAFTGGFYRVDGRDVEGFQALDHKPWSCERGPSAPGGAVGMRRVGRKRAGRLLDGRTWDEYPEVAR